MNAKLPVSASKLVQAVFGHPGVRGDRWVIVLTMDKVTRPAIVADGRRANVTLTPGELAAAVEKAASFASGNSVDPADATALRRAARVLRKLDNWRAP